MSKKNERKPLISKVNKKKASCLTFFETSNIADRTESYIEDPIKDLNLQFQKQVLAKYNVPGLYLAVDLLEESPITSVDYNFQPIWDKLGEIYGPPLENGSPSTEQIGELKNSEAIRYTDIQRKQWIIASGEYKDGIYFLPQKWSWLADPLTKLECQVLSRYGHTGLKLARQMLEDFPWLATPTNYKEIWINLYNKFGEPKSRDDKFLKDYENILRNF